MNDHRDYEVSFTAGGDWEIGLPSTADLNDLTALGPIVQAINEFTEPGREARST